MSKSSTKKSVLINLSPYQYFALKQYADANVKSITSVMLTATLKSINCVPDHLTRITYAPRIQSDERINRAEHLPVRVRTKLSTYKLLKDIAVQNEWSLHTTITNAIYVTHVEPNYYASLIKPIYTKYSENELNYYRGVDEARWTDVETQTPAPQGDNGEDAPNSKFKSVQVYIPKPWVTNATSPSGDVIKAPLLETMERYGLSLPKFLSAEVERLFGNFAEQS